MLRAHAAVMPALARRMTPTLRLSADVLPCVVVKVRRKVAARTIVAIEPFAADLVANTARLQVAALD